MKNAWLKRKEDRELTQALNRQTSKDMDNLVAQWKLGSDKVRIGLTLHECFLSMADNVLLFIGDKFIKENGIDVKVAKRMMIHKALHTLNRMKPEPKGCFNCFTTTMLRTLRDYVGSIKCRDC